MYQTERFDLKLFLAALGAGLLAWIIDAILYGALADRMWRPLLIDAIILGAFAGQASIRRLDYSRGLSGP